MEKDCVKILNDNVINQIRSCFNISSFTQCINELVYNSLDAKSTAIAIRINLTNYRIQVVDNGTGISKTNLELIGERYMTNKCTSLKDLKKIPKLFGFRGEALASICKISEIVTITSREKTTKDTYKKIIIKSDLNTNLIELVNERPSCGTTVTIEGFLYNLPVRQQTIRTSYEIESIKRNLESVIIIHPKVSFSLRNNVDGKLILSNQKCKDVIDSFNNLHRELIIENSFVLMKVTKNKTRVEGLLTKKLYETNKLQYIYVNKRPVVCLSLQKIVTKLFNKFCKVDEDSHRTNNYPIFIILIQLPQNQVGYLQNTNKIVQVEFKSFDIIQKCVEKMVYSFFGIEKTRKPTSNNKKKLIKSCGVSQIEGIVQAFATKNREQLEISPKDDVVESKTNNKKSKTNNNLIKNSGITEIEGVVQAYASKRKLYDPENDDEIIETSIPSIIDNKKSKTTDNETIIYDKTIENYTLFTENPENEDKGREIIMDMFMKSIQVFPSSVNKLFSSQVLQSDKNESVFFNNSEKNLPQSGFNDYQDCDVLEKDKICSSPNSLIAKTVVKFDRNNQRMQSKSVQTDGFFLNKLMKETVSSNQIIIHENVPLIVSTPPPPPVRVGDVPSYEFSSGNFQKNISNEKFSFDNFQNNVPTNKFRSKNIEKNVPIKKFCLENFQKFAPTNKSEDFQKKVPIQKFNLGNFEKNVSTNKLGNFENISTNCKFSSENFQKSVSSNNSEIFEKIAATNNKFSSENFQKNLPTNIFNPENCSQIPSSQNVSKIFNFDNKKSERKIKETPKINSTSLFNNKLSTIKKTTKNLNLNIIKSPYFTLRKKKPDKNLLKLKKIIDNSNLNNGNNKLITTPATNFPILEEEDKNCSKYFNKTKTQQFFSIFSPTNNQNLNDFEDEKTFNFSLTPNINNTTKKATNFLENIQITTKTKKPDTNFVNTSKYFNNTTTTNVPNTQKTMKTNSINQPETFITPTFHENPTNFCTDLVISLNENDKEKIFEKDLKFEFEINKFLLSQQTTVVNNTNEHDWIKKINNIGNVFYLNKRTGMISLNSPKVDVKFDLHKRYEFLPKGLSQNLIQTNKLIDQSLSLSGKENLQMAILENYNNDELLLIKWQNYNSNKTAKEFFEELYKEKAKLIENFIPNINNNIRNCFEENLNYHFTNDLFDNLEIIGQMDLKFIVTLDKSLNLLILFDQHAVHERIRLELLLKGYKNTSVKINQTITIFLNQMDLSLINKHKIYINSLGIYFELFSNGLIIYQLPLSIYNKKKKDDMEYLNTLIANLIQEIIELLKNNNGIVVSMPQIIQNIIKTEACRGAIKFGDFLTKNECELQLKNLSKCNLPFQCAHGRPTLVPLIKFDDNNYSFKINKPNLSKLLKS